MKRILLVYSDLLLSAGVESLLSNGEEFSIRGIAIQDEMVLREEVKLFQPDIVIMDESLLFSEPSFLIGMLRDCPTMRVIVLKIRENRLQLYNTIEVPVSCVEDLISIIQV